MAKEPRLTKLEAGDGWTFASRPPSHNLVATSFIHCIFKFGLARTAKREAASHDRHELYRWQKVCPTPWSLSQTQTHPPLLEKDKLAGYSVVSSVLRGQLRRISLQKAWFSGLQPTTHGLCVRRGVVLPIARITDIACARHPSVFSIPDVPSTTLETTRMILGGRFTEHSYLVR
jgi:hypothetical protein